MLYVVTFLDLCFLDTRLPFCVPLTAKESSCEIMGGRDGAKISGSIIVNASKQIDSCHSAVGQDLVMSISPRKNLLLKRRCSRSKDSVEEIIEIKMHFCCTFRYLSCPCHKNGLVKNTFLHVYSASHLSFGQAQIIS